MNDLQELLVAFKELRGSNAASIAAQNEFRKELFRHSQQQLSLEKKLGEVVSELNQTISSIPKSVDLKQEETHSFRIEPQSVFSLVVLVLVVFLSIWLVPVAKQSLREMQMERDYAGMQEHLNYHIINNPKTERRWQER